MKEISHKTLATIGGGAVAFNGYFGITNLIEYLENKSIVLGELLNKSSDISAELYKIADKTSNEIVGSGGFYSGLLFLIGSGVCAGITLYHSNKKDPN